MLAIINSKTTKREFTAILRRLNEAMFKPSDISQFVGVLKFSEDPVQWQRRRRAERDVDEASTVLPSKPKRRRSKK